MNESENRIYFTGLNSLRFLAAFAVTITHIELLKGSFGFKSYWKNPLIFYLGGLGVYFFFVLSGFLITYLLLVEKEKFQTIKIKEFYIRRILRIWPLYYLIVIIGFFILPKFDLFHISYLEESFINNFTENLLLYLFILPNLAFSLFPAVPNIGQAWSIGVEEQFYLAWPWIISKSKNILKTLLLIIISLFLIKVGVLILEKFYGNTQWYGPLKLFVAMSKFECMAIGGIGAFFLFSKNSILKIFYIKYVLLFSILCIPLLIYITPEFLQDGIHIVYSILFLIIILNVSNNTIKLNFENKMFNYLGKISYGIYMYHFMVIPAVLYTIKNYFYLQSESVINVTAYSFVIVITVFISGISYHFLERPFINLKSKYSPIKSGD
ncbi:MAG: putative acyltransferase [Bacteroidota bacterium]|nr:putative acyltransferase [Bacteroidota bacterium]